MKWETRQEREFLKETNSQMLDELQAGPQELLTGWERLFLQGLQVKQGRGKRLSLDESRELDKIWRKVFG